MLQNSNMEKRWYCCLLCELADIHVVGIVSSICSNSIVTIETVATLIWSLVIRSRAQGAKVKMTLFTLTGTRRTGCPIAKGTFSKKHVVVVVVDGID